MHINKVNGTGKHNQLNTNSFKYDKYTDKNIQIEGSSQIFKN